MRRATASAKKLAKLFLAYSPEFQNSGGALDGRPILNQRHVFGRFGAGDRQFRGDFQAPGLRSGQRRFQGGVFSGKNGASGIHKTK